MIRINIKWKNISPLLQTISGVVIIDDIDIKNYQKNKKIFQCEVHASNHPPSVGYNSLKDDKSFSTEIFHKYKSTLDIMVDSYFRGTMLKELDYVWLDE